MNEVTKLLINYAKSGGSMQALEEAMIQDVVKDLKKYPAARNKSAEEIEEVARDLVRAHVAKRFADKLK